MGGGAAFAPPPPRHTGAIVERALKLFIAVLAIGISLFHLYTGAFGVFETMMQRSIHLTALMTLAFLTYPTSPKFPNRLNMPIDICLALLTLGIGIYNFVEHERIVGREWYYGPMTTWDIVFGVLMILLVLEAARRVTGWALPIIAAFFLAYAMYGQNLPYPFQIRTPPFLVLVDHMFLTPQAIFGIPVGVSATYVFLFVLLGAFLQQTQAGRFFIDLSIAMVGRMTGGPAKVAVISSSFFGTISGHSVANVYATGTFTIPLMKRFGYPPVFAGAVEAAASTGGQIMPPIMGAAAFIMAEFLGINYLEVAVAAIVPAVLYYVALFASTHVEAVRRGLRGLPEEEVPPFRPTLQHGFHFFLPLILIVVVLARGYTPFRAAFVGILSLIGVSMVRKKSRMGVKEFLEALKDGAHGSIIVAVACACAGIVVGVLDVTGLGITFMTVVLGLSKGLFLPTLFLVMVACLILGMGMPTAPAYIIAAMIGAPVLVELGVLPLSAHFFVFGSALLSSITPPVALAAYAGAAIAGADPLRTGLVACRVGFVKFLIPYMYAFNAALLMVGPPMEVVFSTVTATVGTLVLVASLEGWLYEDMPLMLRVPMGIAGFALMVPEPQTDLLGLLLAVTIFWVQRRRVMRHRLAPAVASHAARSAKGEEIS